MEPYELTDEEMRSLYMKWDVAWGNGETGIPWWETLAKAQSKKLLVYLWKQCSDPLHDGYACPRHECMSCMDAMFKVHEIKE